MFSTVLPWYSFDVVLPAGRVVHIFAVTATQWGFTTLAPILELAGALAALLIAGLVPRPAANVTSPSSVWRSSFTALYAALWCPASASSCSPVGTGGHADRQPGVGDKRHRLEAELHFAHDRVMDAFGAGAVKAHVVRGPELAELLAARRQLADEIGQRSVIGVLAGLGAQVSDEI